MRPILLAPARLAALVLGVSLAVVHAIGGWGQVVWVLVVGAGLLGIVAVLAAAARLDAPHRWTEGHR